MSQFMLLLYDDPSSYADLTPEAMQRVVQEYGAWAGKMQAEGRLVEGSKLTDEGGKRLTTRGESIDVTDGPYAESKEVLGGYFVVKAQSYDEAVALARECPHAKYGCRIDVRRVDPVEEDAG